MSTRLAIAETAIEAHEQPRIVLHLVLPSGRQLFVSERATDIPWADGTAIQAYGGLTRVSGVTQRVGQMDVPSFAFAFSADDVDFSDLQDKDLLPGAAVVHVFGVWPNQDYSDRDILLNDARVLRFAYGRGRAAIAMEVGRDDESVSLDIGDDRNLMWWYAIPGETDVPLNDNEFIRRDQGGRPWPLAIGRCYYVPLWQDYVESAGGWAGNLFMVGHKIPTGDLEVYQSDSLTAMSASGVFSQTPINAAHTNADTSTFRPGEAIDYCYINGTKTGGAPFPAEDDWYYTHLLHGGMRDERGDVILGAHMVLRYLLERSGLTIDWRRMDRTLSMLRGLDIGVYIDEQVNVLDLIRKRIAQGDNPEKGGVLPIREQRSGEGAWWSYHQGWRRSPVAHLVDGQSISLIGAVGVDQTKIKNQITVSYGYSYGLGKFTKSVNVGADNYSLAAWSQSAFGLRPAPNVIETTLVGSSSMAVEVGRIALANQCMPRRRLTGYLGREFYWLEPGDVVMIESPASTVLGAPGFGITAVKAEIVARPYALPGRVELLTFEQVPQARSA